MAGGTFLASEGMFCDVPERPELASFLGINELPI